MDDSFLPGSVLVDLYIRLRNQVENHDCDRSSPDQVRASIAMAILSAEAELGANITGVEAHVREVLGLSGPAPIAVNVSLRSKGRRTEPAEQTQ